MSLNPGASLGSYEIVALIGVGGMGEVYRARDTKLNRDVALKVLPALVAGDPERLARFHREAQVLATLNHPNIAQIHGFEDSSSAHALIMELVDGPTLADRIEQGPIPLAEALAIARQIADALEAAHERGIVHRDLKPANVKVRDDGTVKVLDFGLAKVLDPTTGSGADLANSPTLTARSTQLGVILGTAAYMAPEQAKGKAIDRRVDIWAFGVVLFEMLAGQRAFKGDDVSDVLAAVLRQEIDWRALPADTPPKIRRVLARCLERDPKRRLRDIGDAWIELDAPEEPVPVTAVPAARAAAPIARWLPWIVALAIAGGSLAWAMLRSPVPSPQLVVRSQADSKDITLFVNLSRDGTRLAYSLAGGGTTSLGIGLRMLDQFEGKVIPGTEGGAFPLFSPDGQWIAYTSLADGKLKKVPVTGGTSITLCDGRFNAGAAWGDDDTIVFSAPAGLMRVAAAGGTPQTLTKVDAAKGERAHARPQFLPGGERLLFTVTSANADTEPKFAVLDLKAGTYRTVASGGANGRYVPTGHLAFVRGSTIFALPFDVDRLEVAGGETPVVEGVSTLGPQDTGDYSVSEAGLLAYVVDLGGQGTTLSWADRTGATKPLPGQSRHLWGTGRLSPDGGRVANGIHGERSTSDIWVLDVERGTPARLTFDGASDFPVWAPDGRRIFYSGTRPGNIGLYSVPADGSGKPVLVLATEPAPRPTSFTPDGKTLMFSQLGPEKRLRLLLLPLPSNGQQGQAHPLHEASAAESEGQISPDGRWVAYTSTESGGGEIYLQPYPGMGSKQRLSGSGGGSPRWSRDGRRLYYWSNAPTARLMEIEMAAGPVPRPGEPREVFQMLSGTTWDITPDPQRFLVETTWAGNGSTIATVTNWFEELRRRAPAKK